jgi:DNA-binding response OmpR family regulator
MQNGSKQAVNQRLAATQDDAAQARLCSNTAAATILLVEDEAAVRNLAARVLRRTGYLVLEATDGDDALRVAAAHAGVIDLLISDLIMPGVDGPTLAATLGRDRPAMRVLLMSGYMQEDLAGRGVGADAAFLGKPFLPDDLMARVRALLARPSAASQPAA